MTTQYKGKHFSILGDSLSTLEGYNPVGYEVFYKGYIKWEADVFAPEDCWWGQVIDALGGKLLANDSWSGSLVCKHPDCEIESYGCSDARTGALAGNGQMPDVIMVLIGLNDFGMGMQLVPNQYKNGLDVFAVAYDRMLEKLKGHYPNAEIWCMTLPLGYLPSNPDYIPPLCRCGGHITDYNRIILKCAESAGCKTIGLYQPQNPYASLEGYHPTAQGMRTIAQTVLEQVEGWQ